MNSPLPSSNPPQNANPLDERAKLHQLQTQALAAILRPVSETIPASEVAAVPIAPDQVARARTELLHKRTREAALAAPKLQATLGEHFESTFHSFAGIQGYPHSGGTTVDAVNFAIFLLKNNTLPSAATWEIITLKSKIGPRLQFHHVNNIRAFSLRTKYRLRFFKIP